MNFNSEDNKAESSPKGNIDEWLNKQPITQPLIEISVVIPAYNEQWRLPPTLIDIIDFLDSKKLHYEIIIVKRWEL